MSATFSILAGFGSDRAAIFERAQMLGPGDLILALFDFSRLLPTLGRGRRAFHEMQMLGVIDIDAARGRQRRIIRRNDQPRAGTHLRGGGEAIGAQQSGFRNAVAARHDLGRFALRDDDGHAAFRRPAGNGLAERPEA